MGRGRLLVLEVFIAMAVAMVMVLIGMSVLMGMGGLEGISGGSGSGGLLVLGLDFQGDAGSKVLDDEHGEAREHHDQGCIAGVVVGPGLGETRVGQGKEGLGEDMDKRDREDNAGAKVLSELDSKTGVGVIADHHGDDASEGGNDHEDKEGDDVVPDDILAVVVLVRGIACASRSVGMAGLGLGLGVIVVMVAVPVSLGMVVVVGMVMIMVVIMIMCRCGGGWGGHCSRGCEDSGCSCCWRVIMIMIVFASALFQGMLEGAVDVEEIFESVTGGGAGNG